MAGGHPRPVGSATPTDATDARDPFQTKAEPQMMPYVIKQGDYLAKLAHRFGFDADTMWNDPKNATLRQLRPNPNILLPGDVLYVPDQNKATAMTPLATGTTNTFVSNAPTVTIAMVFRDPAFASQAFSIQELPELTGLSSQADGTVTFSVPVTCATATLVFTGTGATFPCNIGSLDPIDTLSGVFQRLQHLGFVDTNVTFGVSTLDSIRAALRTFKVLRSTSSTPSGSPLPSTGRSDDAAPPSSAPASTPGDGIPPSSSAAGVDAILSSRITRQGRG